MPVPEIKRFIATIASNDAEIQFQMHPVNIRTKQLYQVYTTYNSKAVRFHMQSSDGLQFLIMDRSVCPKEYLAFEGQLSEAIVNS